MLIFKSRSRLSTPKPYGMFWKKAVVLFSDKVQMLGRQKQKGKITPRGGPRT